jgi:pimeloyl-ACP methyl ester carboxylesterase
MRNALAPRLLDAGVAVWLLRFAVRGWNAGHGPDPSPVPDARWALDRALAEHPGVPVVMLGHSMGARTSVHTADHPAVAGVVALAPWLEPSDPVDTLAGRHLLAAHGSRDRITSARMTRAYVERARPVAASAEFVDMGRLGHYMLHRPRAWNRVALRSIFAVLEHVSASATEECLDRRDG